jgi:hypothetical protein
MCGKLDSDVAKGNSIANSDKRYAHGVVGFNRHLSRGHGQKSAHSKTRLRLEEVLERCTYREVPADEIVSLTENNLSTVAIEKIPFTQTAVTLRKSTGSAIEAKRVARVPKRAYNSDPEDSDLELEQGDSDFDPSVSRKGEPTKRARHSISTTIANSKQPSRLRRKSKGYVLFPGFSSSC